MSRGGDPHPDVTASSSRARPLRPVVAFIGVFAVLLAGGAALLYGSNRTLPASDAPQALPAPAPTALSIPTDEEILARFRELRAISDRIYATRNRALLADAFFPEGPTWSRVEKDLDTLEESNLRFIQKIDTRDLKVLANSSDEIVVREVAISDGRLLNGRGKDVTDPRVPEKHVMRWVLRATSDGWMIYDGTILSAKARS